MKLFSFLIDITLEAFQLIAYAVISNLRAMANILQILLPYAMYLLGQYVFDFRGHFAIGGELLLPVVVYVLIYYLRSLANKYRKGDIVPIPEKRFTEIDDDGEVSIENSRLQELLLYVADLEDWLARKGLL